MTEPVQVFSDLGAVQLPPQPCHLAVGIFDGVHRGHRVVIDGAVAAAKAGGGISGVLTFWPHPSRLFRPDEPVRMIFDPASRRELLARIGVQFIVEQPFTREFAAIEAEAFIPHLRKHLPQLASLHVGENWRFGRGRRGDVALLQRIGREIGLQILSVPRLNDDGDAISSTRIRSLLESGNVAAANTLLGFPYFCHGMVVPGRQLGVKLGFPTLNLDWRPELMPALGIYVVQISSPDRTSAALPAVASYGVRPTVEHAGEPVLEVHVLGPCPFGRGDRVRVEWLERLRSEQKFPSLEALRAQIARDCEAAQAYFSVT